MNQYYFSTVEVFFFLWDIIVFIVFFFWGGGGTSAKVKSGYSLNIYLLSTKKFINTRNGSG